MRRLSIARSLLLALVGLTLTLALVAALEVASLYDARQDYEDDLARSYAGEVGAANLLAAGVVEETVLRSADVTRASRTRAAAAFERAAAAARGAAAGDPASERFVRTAVAEQARVRRIASGRQYSATRLAGALRDGRAAAQGLAARQAQRREAAHDRVQTRTHRALVAAGVAGVLAVLAALALVSALVGGLRRPLAGLVEATRRLADGDLDARVEPDGPQELRELSSSFNAMAEDLDLARERIEAGRRRLASVVESLGDALVICDGFGRVVQVNPRAESLVPEIKPGQSIATDRGPLPPLDEVLDREAEILHGGRTLSVTAARMGLRLEDGVVFTVRDMTERARLEQAKSEFVATASHELRSPLTSIKGFVELMAASDLQDRHREFIEIILLSTNRLVDLVNDLLDVARVEAGQLEIQRRPIAVAEAVREVATLMAPRFEEKDQHLAVEIAPALPVAHADPARVRQIVTNLLTNAHLYTPEGGRVTVSVGAAGDDVLLSVADTGRGMTPEQVGRVFDRFYRAESAGPGGSGLGLSIVKSLVELHEGSIQVSSRVDQGTTVTVRLPRAPAAEDLVEPRQAIRGRCVLIVEDEPEIASLIAEQLRPYEVDVVVVHDGEAAIAELRRRPYDAVTLDILLGGIDGFEVLRTIREDPRLRRTPVIVVSVMAGQETLAAEWSVTKPIDAQELTDAIGSAILASRARVLVVGRAGMREIVGPLLERRGIEFEWATSGAEAARMCEETHYEVALVDAGMRSPQSALAQLDLRGRRLRRSVVVFSTGEPSPGLARLDPDPVPVEDATAAVVHALRTATGVESGR
jgi:signal transduction histidine kinase/DNA-binding response OmpR family regulator/HAMP domain-containing protein